jgi:hypothetical protein
MKKPNATIAEITSKMKTNIEPCILKVETWHTIATDYKLGKVGSAELVRSKYKKGLYMMEGVAGYDFFQVVKPIEVTSLKINGKIWMVDDPLHWIGMQMLAKHSNMSKGKILVGGLGLGLLPYLLLHNTIARSIEVIEKNPDVIKLMGECQLPDSDRLHVKEGDIFEHHVSRDAYDTIILDVWVGKASRLMAMEMLRAFVHFKGISPMTNIYIWGSNERSINPAVTKQLCGAALEIKKNAMKGKEK